MGKAIRSNFILIAMISICLATATHSEPREVNATDKATVTLSKSAENVATTLLLANTLPRPPADAAAHLPIAFGDAMSLTERALSNANDTASVVASELEMPFFSFGGGRTSSE